MDFGDRDSVGQGFEWSSTCGYRGRALALKGVALHRVGGTCNAIPRVIRDPPSQLICRDVRLIFCDVLPLLLPFMYRFITKDHVNR